MSIPSPSLPPEVPTRSLTPVVVALLIGIAVIAVVVVKVSSPAEPAPQPEVASAAPKPPPPAAPPPSAEAPPPPPPPSPAEAVAPASAPRPVASVPKAVVQGPASKRDPGCDDPCRGSATDELVRALSAKGAQSRTCYERALSNNSALSGRLEVAVRVSPAGTVCSAATSADTLGDPAVASCVLTRFKSGVLPRPTGGCVDASVPINFKPSGAH